MKRTILVCGHGPGISDSVARKFGAEGFQVAIVARSADRLEIAAKALTDKGITAKAFTCDLGDMAAVTKLVADVRAALGPITVLHWNAYIFSAGNLLTDSVDDLRKIMDVNVYGIIAATQQALPDMKSQKDAAVLVTGGGFAFYDPKVDAMAVEFNAMGIAVGKAAQHKLAGVLHEKLKADGIYVGEVVVLGSVKGTAFDRGQATLEPSAIADKFWSMYQSRSEATATYSG